MAWIYLAVSEDSPWLWHHGSDQLPTVREIDTVKPCYLRGKELENCPARQSAKTCSGCLRIIFQGKLTSSMVDGQLYEHQTMERHTKGEDGSCWLGTPRAGNGQRSEKFALGRLPTPEEFVKMFSTPTARDWRTGDKPTDRRAMTRDHSPNLNDVASPGGKLSPMWVEWLMNYPIGWTELSHLVIQWYRSKRKKHLNT